MMPTPSPNGTLMHRVDHERIREEPRVMNDHALIPVNAFGIPQETMRCLEVRYLLILLFYLLTCGLLVGRKCQPDDRLD
jgi:hypothetical protein